MIFTDGECPICTNSTLHLNTVDLLECPQCGLMVSMAERIIAPILHERGKGKFRFEDCALYPMSGVLLARAQKGNSVLADHAGIFEKRSDIEDYLSDVPKKAVFNDASYDLWFKFKQRFCESITKEVTEIVFNAWSSKTSRTSYYKDSLMPIIANSLGLIHGSEEFKVDYVMSKDVGAEYSIPQIYIESENNFQSSDHEIKKLCSINSPLRVLVTIWDGWDMKNLDNATVYNSLRAWKTIITDHGKYNSEWFNGTIGIIIGSKIDERIYFRSCSFWNDGEIRQPIDEFCVVK